MPPQNISEFAQAVLALQEQQKALKMQQRWANEQRQMERERWESEKRLMQTQMESAQLQLEQQGNQLKLQKDTRANETALMTAWSEMLAAQENAANPPGHDPEDSLGMKYSQRRLESATKRFAEARTAAAATPGAFASLFAVSEGLVKMKSMPENVRLEQAKMRAEIMNTMSLAESRTVTASGAELEAQKKAMDLRFDGIKVMEKEVAPESVEDIRKRWDERIRGTQDTGAALASNINQLVSTLALNPDTPESVKELANTMTATARKVQGFRSAPKLDASAIAAAGEEMLQTADLFSNRIVIRPGSVQEQQLTQLRQNVEDYRAHITAVINQRNDMERELTDTNTRLQMAHSLYGDFIDVNGMSPIVAARESARRVRDIFDEAAPAQDELRMTGAYTKGLSPAATPEDVAAAMAAVQERARKYGSNATNQAVLQDVLSKDFLRQRTQRAAFAPRPSQLGAPKK